MQTTAKDRTVAARIARRLASDDDVTFRAGGRAVAHQAIEHRLSVARLLEAAVALRREQPMDDRRRGYLEALEDVLLAAEAALAPVERAALARRALALDERYWMLIRRAADAPLTPGAAAKATGTSDATGTRDLDRLVAAGLLTELPAADGRQRWHRASPLARRLLAERDGPPRCPAPDEEEDVQVVSTRAR